MVRLLWICLSGPAQSRPPARQGPRLGRKVIDAVAYAEAGYSTTVSMPQPAIL